MKRFWLVFVVLVLMTVPSLAVAQDSGARFSEFSGEVIVFPDRDRDDERPAEREMVLAVKDHIKTGGDSSAIIGFADMSTFVMKPRSEVVLDTPPEQKSKVTLLAGNIWVNVKKMVQDGSLDVTMNQAVAGIKGTNITCSTDKDAGEDRVKVLRGMAQVLILESQEIIPVEEGQELVIKKGKTQMNEINVEESQKEWKKELEQMGNSLQLNEVPDTIQRLMRSEQMEFAAVVGAYQNLVNAEVRTEAEVQEFRKLLERFAGMLQEDTLVLASLRLKVENELVADNLTAANRVLLANYQKQIGDAISRQQSYRAEIGKMAKADIKPTVGGAVPSDQEAEQIAAALQETWSTVQGLVTEAQAMPSQSWFLDAIDKCDQAMTQLQQQAERARARLELFPQDKLAASLLKQIAGYQAQIAQMMRDFRIVEVPAATISQMQDIEDHMGDAISALQNEISAYNTNVAGTDAAERRLRSSLAILNDFSKTRRLYLNAQRLFDATMRAAAGQKFKSAEQVELQGQFDRISDTFQQLGSVADELNSRLNDLERQLSGFLK